MNKNGLILFEGRHQIMILMKEDVNFEFKGDFLISAKDVADVLEYQGKTATSNVLKFCKETHVYSVFNSDLLNREVRKLNNAGEKFISNLSLNRVLGQSGQPKAEPFQDWLYEDVVPAVQKHGMYATDDLLNNPDLLIAAGQKLKEEQETRRRLEAQIAIDRPKVLFAEAVSASQSSILIRELATLLKQNGIDIGQNRLFNWLRENGYLVKRFGSDRNTPTQRAMNLGLFEVNETVVHHNSGLIEVKRTTKVTGKGQRYFIDKFLEGVA